MTFTHAVSTNNYGPAKFIVSANAYEGTHTTIAAALTSASSGDTIFIRPGTYTENLTLKAGVNLTAYACDGTGFTTNNVTIVGKATLTTAGTVNITGIQLQTNSDFLLVVSGSAASIVNLTGCFLNCPNNTGISFTSSSSSAKISCINCQGNLGTTGITYFVSTSTGALDFSLCTLNNSGASSTASTLSAGSVSYFACGIGIPTTSTSTGSITLQNCNIDTSGTNTITITHGGTGGGFLFFNYMASGTAATISVGTGASIAIIKNNINSTNANPITGAGTANFDSNSFSNSGTGINSTTKGYYPSLLGTPGSTAPAAGFIGEILSSAVTAQTITVNTITNFTSLTPTAGIWEITGIALFNIVTGVSVTSVQACLATANNNFTPIDNFGANISNGNANLPFTSATMAPSVLLGPCRLSTTGSTVVYLNAFLAATSAVTRTVAVLIRAVRVG